MDIVLNTKSPKKGQSFNISFKKGSKTDVTAFSDT